MPIALPTLPELGPYPAAGTDTQRDQWLRLAGLHVGRAQVQATEQSATANEGLAQVHRQIMEQQTAFNGALGGFAEAAAEVWDRLDASLNRLAAAVEARPAGGAASAEGITDKDIEQIGKIKEVLKP